MDHRGLAACEAPLPRIEALITQLHDASAADLAAAIASVRARVTGGTSPDAVLPEVFATLAQARARLTGEPVTRQHLVAGVALYLGFVTDIEDSPGGDVAVLLAAVLRALEGQGAHVLTAADHLAQRQAAQAHAICAPLGVRVGVLEPARKNSRKDAYTADITYGAAEQFGYDLLRDNLAWALDDTVQRGQHSALVVDADVVLLDRSRTPMMITVPARDRDSRAEHYARLATSLISGRHYVMSADRGVIALTDEGTDLATAQLGVADIYDPDGTIITGIRTALRAKELYRRGRDYDIVDSRIVRLDTVTGARSNAALSSGLRQALEAKEGLALSDPTTILATITMRSYLRRYRRLSGIGTSAAAIPEAWQQLYGLDVVTVPADRPSGRVDHDDRLFPTDAQRDDAVLADVLTRRDTGQPVVIGTVTIPAAEHMVAELTDVGIPVRHAIRADPEQVSTVLAAAGEAGAVTVLPSAACRGAETVIDGVAVLGIGRHRSRRHDQRLRALAGRNGTSGECAFFLSLADLATGDGGEEAADALPPLPAQGMQNSALTADVAQRQRDADLAVVRADVTVSGFDDVRQQQYQTLADYRRRILTIENLSGDFQQIVRDVVDALIAEHLTADEPPARPAIESLLAAAAAIPLTVSADKLTGATRTRIRDRLHEDAARACRARSAKVDKMVGPGASAELQRRVILSCLDRFWRTHLITLDELYEDVIRRAASPADMLAEFRVEATAAFQAIWPRIRAESVRVFFQLEIRTAK